MKRKRTRSPDAEAAGGDAGLRADPQRTSEPAADLSRHEEIRHRAYELYVERGQGDGDDMGDWLQAEREYASRTGARDRGSRDAAGEARLEG